MKRTSVLIFLFSVVINVLIAQNDRSNWIGVNASVSTGELMYYSGYLDGDIGYDGKIGFLIGVGFSKVINDRFDFESGIDFSRNTFKYSYVDGHGEKIQSVNPEHIDLLSIPLNIRVKLKNKFFITGGVQYDQRINVIDSPTIPNHTGIGVNVKIGKDINISDKMVLYIAPEFLLHNAIPFYEKNQAKKLTEFGLRISYKFKVSH